MEDSEGMTDDAKLEHIMAVLRATPGCTGASPSSYNGPDLNKMDVHVRVNGRMIRRSESCEFDTKLKMALHVRSMVENILGKDVFALAEEQLTHGGSTSSQAAELEQGLTQEGRRRLYGSRRRAPRRSRSRLSSRPPRHLSTRGSGGDSTVSWTHPHVRFAQVPEPRYHSTRRGILLHVTISLRVHIWICLGQLSLI